jgi:hypothetical protein
MAVQSPLRKVFRSVFSNTFNLTVNFLSRIGGGSVVTYLSRLLTSSTTTPYYSGTTNIVDTSSTGDYREIQPGRCLDFDGATQYVETTGDTPAFTLPVTFSFWISAATGGDYGVCYTHGTNSNYYGVWAYINTSRYPAFHFGDGRSPGSSTRRTAVSSIALGANQWHYVVGIIRGVEDVDIYIDGVKDQSVTYSGTGGALALTSASFRVGNNNLDTAPLEGKLFDVRFYDDELTAAEITALYRQGLQPDAIVEGQPDATNLVGRWLLDDNSQTTAYDSSGNGNHGTIVGYASGMLYEGDDVPYSAQNLVGWSNRTNLLSSTYSFTSEWNSVSSSQGSYSNITLSNGQPGLRLECSSQRYYRSKVLNFESGQYTLKIYAENITGPLSRPVAQLDGYSGSAIYDSSFNAEGWAAKTFTHSGGTSRIRWGIGTDANDSGAIDLTYFTLEKGDTRSTLNPQNCKPNSGFMAGPSIAPRDESIPANDVLGNPLDYTGTVPKYATPVDAPCLTFDGTNKSILLNTPISDASTSHTWAAWVKVVDKERDSYLFDKNGGTRMVLNLHRSLAGSGNIAIYSGVSWDEFAVGVNDDTWHHVAFKISGTTAEIFVDGVSGGSVTITETSIDGTSQVIASRYSQDDFFLEGGLCDFRVYNTALSDTDIAAIYAGEEIDSDPIFWMPMSEGDGNTVYDVVNGDSYTITSYVSTMWDNTQDQFFYSFENGCRESSGVAIPALADGSTAATGDAITGLPGLLNSDTYNLNLLPEPDAPYQRSAIPGATFDGVGDYVDTGVTSVPDEITIETVLKMPSSFGLRLAFGGYGSPPSKDRLYIGCNASGQVIAGCADKYQNTLISSSSFSVNEWLSIRMIVGAGVVQVFVNDVLEIDDTYTQTLPFALPRIGRVVIYYWPSSIQSVSYSGLFAYDFRENNGLIIPDRSGNGNDGTLVVNSSLAQIFAPTALETAYTLGDGRTRPHYVTIDGPNEKDFRTEII